jgi:ribosome-associated protein
MHTKHIKGITYPIRLGQFLKLISAVQDGIEAKILIQSGSIMVNGQAEVQRGKQLQKNDVVQLADGTSFVLN